MLFTKFNDLLHTIIKETPQVLSIETIRIADTFIQVTIRLKQDYKKQKNVYDIIKIIHKHDVDQIKQYIQSWLVTVDRLHNKRYK